MKYIEERKIESIMVGTDNKMNILHMYMLTQDVTCHLLNNYGLSNPYLRSIGYMWVFTKNKLIIENNYLTWGKDLYIECFISQINHVSIYIDTLVKDKDNNLIFKSRIEAAILSIETRRLTRISNFEQFKNVSVFSNDFKPFEKLDNSEGKLIDTHKIKYSSLDLSYHTNNLEYIRFILDTFREWDFSSYNIKECEIHYIKESKLDDNLEIYLDDDVYIIKRDNDIISKMLIKRG